MSSLLLTALRLSALSALGAVALLGCAELDDVTTKPPGDLEFPGHSPAANANAASMTIALTTPTVGVCSDLCVDVTSNKDVGFIALDVARCGDAAPLLELYSVDAQGVRTRVAAAPVPHGNGKSCPNIPPGALKFDGLSGSHFVACIDDPAAQSAGNVQVFVKSGKSCEGGSFAGTCAPRPAPGAVSWSLERGATYATGDVATDGQGNVFHALGPVSGEHPGLTKLDPKGNDLWNVPFGSAVSVDVHGNPVLAGSSDTPVDLGTGTLEPEGGYDVFVARLAADGTAFWARRLGGVGDEGVESVAVDRDMNVVVSGAGLGTLKLDPDGEQLWHKDFHGDVAVDSSGNVLVTGGFDAMDFGDGTVESDGAGDAFVVKLDASGELVWSQFIGDPALPIARPGSHGGFVTEPTMQVGKAIAVDPDDNVLISGEFPSAIDLFGEDSATPLGPSEVRLHGAYLAKLDASGSVLWKMTDTPVENVMGLASDAQGNVLWSRDDFSNVRPFKSNRVSKVSPTGTVLWSREELPEETSGRGLGGGIAADPCGNVFWSASARVYGAIDPEAFTYLLKLAP